MKSATTSDLNAKKKTANESDMAFLKGKNLFVDKTERAKEKLKNVTLPPR